MTDKEIYTLAVIQQASKPLSSECIEAKKRVREAILLVEKQFKRQITLLKEIQKFKN